MIYSEDKKRRDFHLAFFLSFLTFYLKKLDINQKSKIAYFKL